MRGSPVLGESSINLCRLSNSPPVNRPKFSIMMPPPIGPFVRLSFPVPSSILLASMSEGFFAYLNASSCKSLIPLPSFPRSYGPSLFGVSVVGAKSGETPDLSMCVDFE